MSRAGKKSPLIGITVDLPVSSSKRYKDYVLRKNYVDVVQSVGGIALLLPYDEEGIIHYVKNLDGLIISGGDFDVDPRLFGVLTRHSSVKLNSLRTDFEYKLTSEALSQDKPLLGICGGQQLLNVVLGGSLIQDISTEVSGSLEHEQKHPRDRAGHGVNVVSDTLLSSLLGGRLRIDVNSAHHQAVNEAGKDVIVNCRADDGIIEGIEYPRNRFCLGVQYHPEYLVSDADNMVFKGLIDSI